MPARRLPLTALAEACRSAPPRCGGTRVIAVDGRSGAGKTSLTAALATLLNRPAPLAAPAPAAGADDVHPAPAAGAAVVHLDDLYPGWDGLAAAVPLLVSQLLRPLAAGLPAGFHRHDWAAGARGRWEPVAPTGLLLLDGVGSGARACAPYLSLLLWLDAAPAVRRERAIARDGQAFARQWDRWARQEEAYVRAERVAGRADLVLEVTSPGTLQDGTLQDGTLQDGGSVAVLSAPA